MKTQAITVDFRNALSKHVGKHGVARDKLFALQPRIDRYHAQLCRERASGKLRFADLPHNREYPRAVSALAKELIPKCRNFVVLGIGGSALGNIAVQTALNSPHYNLLPQSQRKGCPRIFVEDNIDPDRFVALLDMIDLKKTVFNVITKSGQTAETMSQFLIIQDMLKKKLGRSYNKHIVATTDAKGGFLRPIAEAEGYRTLEVPDGVGGRFSVLSPVGLLSAAMAGINIRQLLKGAADMDKRCQTASLKKNPAYLCAALLHQADTRKNLHTVVLMPYCDALKDVSDWFRQLWAESLGKRLGRGGKEVFTGQNPVKALGTTDQHSQVQLYVEGPFDKIIAFLAVDRFARTIKLPKTFSEVEGISYLGGKSLNQLMHAELQGTAIALADAGRPNFTIHLPSVNAHTVGQLIFMFEMQTAMAGKLYGINTFDQPGVEAGKTATYALMGRKGFEKEKRRIAGRIKANHSDRV